MRISDWSSDVCSSDLQNAPGGTPKWLYRIQANWATDGFNLNLTGRGISSGVYDNSLVECNSGCPASTVTNRTINDNPIAGALYLDPSLTFDVEMAGKEIGRASVRESVCQYV